MTDPVTTADLIAALRGERTLEQLAREIDVPLRTMQRWAATDDPEKGPQWRYNTSRLLALAGWLNVHDDPVPARLPEDPLGELRGAVEATFVLVQGVQDRLRAIEDRLPDKRPRSRAATSGKRQGAAKP